MEQEAISAQIQIPEKRTLSFGRGVISPLPETEVNGYIEQMESTRTYAESVELWIMLQRVASIAMSRLQQDIRYSDTIRELIAKNGAK